MDKKLIVIALGGNALSRAGQKGTIDEMRANVREALHNLYTFIEQGHRVVITHGNGPQVGVHLLKEDAGKQVYDTPIYPLDVLVADTQGEIGYLIESELRNLLAKKRNKREVASLVTMVEVDAKDPAFEHPTKRVGVTYYDWEDVQTLKREKGWIFKEEIKNGETGWRRVVPSPQPKKIINLPVIETLVRNEYVVIAAGGGGISVAGKNQTWEPVEAVIDKDLASSLLARSLHADRLIILTDVPYVYIHYGTPDQKPLIQISLKELDTLIENKAFGEGNMLPKILAARAFVAATGKKALITDFEGLTTSGGTEIVP